MKENPLIFEKLELLELDKFYSIIAIHKRICEVIPDFDWSLDKFMMWLMLYTPTSYPLKYYIDSGNMKIKRMR